MLEGYTTAQIDGHRWYWKRGRLSSVLEVKIHTMVWHLWNSLREYQGNFSTQREMLAFIEANAPF